MLGTLGTQIDLFCTRTAAATSTSVPKSVPTSCAVSMLASTTPSIPGQVRLNSKEKRRLQREAVQRDVACSLLSAAIAVRNML